MKHFIYLDTDIITSIIAQSEKGVVTQQTSEIGSETQQKKEKGASIATELSGTGKFWKFLQAKGTISVVGQLSGSNTTQSSSRDIVDKILHDAAFDIACDYIVPLTVELNDQENYSGPHVKTTRRKIIVNLKADGRIMDIPLICD